jgi:hypothetical protein
MWPPHLPACSISGDGFGSSASPSGVTIGGRGQPDVFLENPRKCRLGPIARQFGDRECAHMTIRQCLAGQLHPPAGYILHWCESQLLRKSLGKTGSRQTRFPGQTLDCPLGRRRLVKGREGPGPTTGPGALHLIGNAMNVPLFCWVTSRIRVSNRPLEVGNKKPIAWTRA